MAGPAPPRYPGGTPMRRLVPALLAAYFCLPQEARFAACKEEFMRGPAADVWSTGVLEPKYSGSAIAEKSRSAESRAPVAPPAYRDGRALALAAGLSAKGTTMAPSAASPRLTVPGTPARVPGGAAAVPEEDPSKAAGTEAWRKATEFKAN